MDESEFDKFALEYHAAHAANISASGETPEFFAEYKVVDAARMLRAAHVAPDSILDFGCGVGNSIPYLRRHFPQARIVGADVSSKSLELAQMRFRDQARFSSIRQSCIDLADASCDLIFSACVFHHIPHEEHDLWLRELRRVARPGAMLVIFEHNPWNPLTVRAVNTCAFDANARLITPFALKGALRRAGWTSTRHEFRIFFPRSLAPLRRFEASMRWLPLGAQHSVSARA